MAVGGAWDGAKATCLSILTQLTEMRGFMIDTVAVALKLAERYGYPLPPAMTNTWAMFFQMVQEQRIHGSAQVTHRLK